MAHILIAEDDASMRQFLTLALTRAGHRISACGDGLQALAMLEDTSDIDLLLSDIIMPGMDGIELAQRASGLRPALKIMFITGFAAVAMDGQPPTAKATPLLSKPFHLNDLVERIESLLSV